MDRYGEMLVFIRAVEDGSFSAAGRNLSLTPASVSKLVARTEARRGTMLFQRSRRNPVLTADGEVFYTAALRAVQAISCGWRSFMPLTICAPAGWCRCSRIIRRSMTTRSMPSMKAGGISAIASARSSNFATKHFLAIRRPGKVPLWMPVSGIERGGK